MIGTFRDGMFSEGTFSDGMFSDGMFSNGTFSDGTFCMRTKKTEGRKSLWTVPLNRIQKSHMTPRSMIPRNLNQNRKYFNPYNPGRFKWWKKWWSKISLDCVCMYVVLFRHGEVPTGAGWYPRSGGPRGQTQGGHTPHTHTQPFFWQSLQII